MSDFSVQLRIAMAEAESAIKSQAIPDGIEDRFRKAASVTRDHWMCTNEDERFRATVGAVMLSYGESSPEYDRIRAEMKTIQMFNAFITAAEAGLSVNFLEDTEMSEHEPIGLLKIWREMK